MSVIADIKIAAILNQPLLQRHPIGESLLSGKPRPLLVLPPPPWAIVAQGALYPNPKSLRMNHADEMNRNIATMIVISISGKNRAIGIASITINARWIIYHVSLTTIIPIR